jgi:MipA family protein
MKRIWICSKFMVLALAAALSTGVSLPAAADDILPPAQAERPTILGLGVVYRDKTYKGYETSKEWSAFPLVVWENDRFFVRGTSAGWKAWSNETWSFDVLAEFVGEGYDSSDADILTGMDDADPTVQAGVALGWRSNGWGVRGVVAHDVANVNEGWEARAELSYTHVSDNRHWVITPMTALVYQSDDMVDYYYGVGASDAIPGIRPQYDADGEFTYRLQTVAAWNPGGSKWQLFLGGRVDVQGDEYDNSPLTSTDLFWMGFAGAGYRF